MRRLKAFRATVAPVVATLLLLPAAARAQSKPLVGVEQVKDMQVALFVWPAERGVILPPLHTHPHGEGEPAGPATHHLEVTVFDSVRRVNVPYLTITATIQNRLTGRAFTVELPPMIANTFHYGDNVTLVKGNRYSILLDISPAAVVRGQAQKEVWNTPLRVAFEYEYR